MMCADRLTIKSEFIALIRSVVTRPCVQLRITGSYEIRSEQTINTEFTANCHHAMANVRINKYYFNKTTSMNKHVGSDSVSTVAEIHQQIDSD